MTKDLVQEIIREIANKTKSIEFQKEKPQRYKQILNEYDNLILQAVSELGGFFNTHTHLDRSNTLDEKYLRQTGIDPIEGASLSLKTKQNLTGELHLGQAYTEEDIYTRIRGMLEAQISMMTTSVVSFVDATPDLPENGLLAVNVAKKIKEEMSEIIDFKIAASPIFGFKEDDRWEVYKEAASLCDILGGLPEKDEPKTNGRIGDKGHLKRILELGQDLKKEVHVHADQANDPSENGAKILILATEWTRSPKIENKTDPTVWAIHSISPSCYDEKRFQRMITGLARNNIGVICCPSAALSMRQLRPIISPMHNSIARILEMMEIGVRVKIGTDNICDVFVPSSDGSMLTEMKYLSNALRFYSLNILAKISAGHKLNKMDKEIIRRSLAADKEIFERIR